MSQGNGNAPKFGIRKNVRQIGRTDVAGGGQVVVENGYAFVGHMDPPHGTTILDVKDPKHPKIVAEIEIPQGVHSHKVRVSGDIMLVNLERYRSKEKQPAGLKVYDISNREKPKEIAFFQTNGGVHRFTFDGRYAYISAHIEGYVGRIPMILDLKDPARPEEVGRWWMPGQWIGGGETPTWEGTAHQCHHPIRRGDRLYTSYWHGGFVILDIADMSRPKYISGYNWSPTYPSPIHTTLPIPWKLMNRDVMVVSDEEAGKLAPMPYAFMWMVDITDETRPVPISTFNPAEAHSIEPGPSIRRAPARRTSLRQQDVRHLVQRRPARRRHQQSLSADRDWLLRARTGPRPKDGQEQRYLPCRQWLAVFDRPAGRVGDTGKRSVRNRIRKK